MIPIEPDNFNGLTKPSSVDAFQVRAIAVERFVRNLGNVDHDFLEQAATAIGVCVDHPTL